MKRKAVKILTTGLVLTSVLGGALTGCGKSVENKVEEQKTEVNVNSNSEEAETVDLYDEIIKRGVIKVGTEGTYAPNTYHDDDGKLVGFDVEVAAIIAKYIGVEVEYVETEWSSIFASLDAGTIDVVVNEVGYNDERALKYDFSQPYAFVQKAILVKNDTTDINTLEDIFWKKAANESTSLLGALALEYGAELDPVNEMAQSISEVLNGRADLTLNYVTSFNDYTKEHPEADVKVIPVGEAEPTSYIPVIKGNEKLVEAINEALKEALENGELKAISEKYFGVDVTAANK